ncbi:A24 family peptidase [Actinokineospora sp. NBRC 105648]|uniref:prepilin peptidase n=1 Tax=Actinokineospora sp. NBRC 105648 TaxID=3032206 RepID=UPI002553A46C|nr:A24 family peptidase [Actinokineospora sp. NBRC 105648]
MSLIPRGTNTSLTPCATATALLWSAAAVGRHYGVLPDRWFPVVTFLVWLAVPLTIVDLRHRRLPNALTLPAFPVAAALIAFAAPSALVLCNALLGAVLLTTFHALIHLTAPAALGMGDVKLAPTLGAILGAADLHTLPTALLIAAMATLALHRLHRPQWRTGIPHGPGLLAATIVLAVLNHP